MSDKIKSFMSQKLKSAISIFIILAIGIVLLVAANAATGLNLTTVGRLSEYSDGWTGDDGRGVNLAAFYNIKSTSDDGTSVAHNTLPQITTGDCLNITGRFINFIVLVDGQEIYNFDSKNLFSGSVFDTYYHHIPLSPDMSWKEITLLARNTGGTARMNFSGLMIGPSHLHVQYVMTKSGFAFLLAIFLIMVGIIGLINEISQKYLKYRYSRNSLYLSGIIGGYWIMIESNVPILLLPDSTELLLLTKYLSLLVFPVPAFCLITSILPHKTKSWTIALMVIDVISIVAALGLTAGGTLEWHECLFFFYIMALYVIIVSVELFIASLKDAATEHAKVDIDWWMFAGVLIVTASVIFDAFFFISDNGSTKDAPTTLFGAIIALVLTIIDTELEARKHLADTGYLMNERDKAYTDQLTGILNRTAYERDSDILRDNFSKETLSGNAYLDSHFDLLIAYFDINNFKHVNDTLGHDVGDKVIQAAATLINKAFSKYGNVYRVGGDEFCATMTGDDLDRSYGRALHDLRMEEEDWNRDTKLNITLSIASGSAKLSDTESGTIHEVLKNADNDMYIHKAEMKKNDPNAIKGA